MDLETAVKEFESRFAVVTDGMKMVRAETGEDYVTLHSCGVKPSGESILAWFTNEEAAVTSWLKEAIAYSAGKGRTLYWRLRPGVVGGPEYITDGPDGRMVRALLSVRSRMLVSDMPVVYVVDDNAELGYRQMDEWPLNARLDDPNISETIRNWSGSPLVVMGTVFNPDGSVHKHGVRMTMDHGEVIQCRKLSTEPKGAREVLTILPAPTKPRPVTMGEAVTAAVQASLGPNLRDRSDAALRSCGCGHCKAELDRRALANANPKARYREDPLAR